MLSIVRMTLFSFACFVAFICVGMFVMVGFMRFLEVLVPAFDRFWRMVL